MLTMNTLQSAQKSEGEKTKKHESENENEK